MKHDGGWCETGRWRRCAWIRFCRIQSSGEQVRLSSQAIPRLQHSRRGRRSSGVCEQNRFSRTEQSCTISAEQRSRSISSVPALTDVSKCSIYDIEHKPSLVENSDIPLCNLALLLVCEVLMLLRTGVRHWRFHVERYIMMAAFVPSCEWPIPCLSPKPHQLTRCCSSPLLLVTSRTLVMSSPRFYRHRQSLWHPLPRPQKYPSAMSVNHCVPLLCAPALQRVFSSKPQIFPHHEPRGSTFFLL